MGFVSVASSKATAPSTRSWSPGEIEFDVLRVFLSERSPLTKGQLEARTGIAVANLSPAVDHLCSNGRLSRLNTLVESYALPSFDAPTPLGASVCVVPGGAAETTGTTVRHKGR